MTTAYSISSNIPTGSGKAIRAAGIWKIGVYSPQLEPRNSIDTIAGDAGHEQHHDIGEREASPLAAGRKPAQDHPNEGMIAPPIGNRAADERQDRQRQPCDLVGPQEGVREIDPRGDIGQHQHEFAEERGHDDAFGGEIDQTEAAWAPAGPAPPRAPEAATGSADSVSTISIAPVRISS